MKNRYSYILMAIAFAGLTSCSNENISIDTDETLADDCSFINFNPSVGIDASSSSTTRLTDDLDDGYTYFSTGTYNFGICVMKSTTGNSDIQESNAYVPWKDGETGTETLWKNSGFQSYFNINGQYTKKTANASDTNSELNWYLTAANGKELYLSRDKAAVALRRKEDQLPKIFAYYPWQNIDNGHQIPIPKFEDIDYLYATPLTITTSDFVEDTESNREYYRAKLRFNHVTSKIVFNICNLNKTEADTVYSVKAFGDNIASSGTYDIATGAFTPIEHDTITTISPAVTILPKQTVSDAFHMYIAPTNTTDDIDETWFRVLFDIFSISDKTTSVSMPKLDYQAGKVYTITIYISSNRVQFGEPQVEDWINYKWDVESDGERIL